MFTCNNGPTQRAVRRSDDLGHAKPLAEYWKHSKCSSVDYVDDVDGYSLSMRTQATYWGYWGTRRAVHGEAEI